jgi:ribonuclease VapC
VIVDSSALVAMIYGEAGAEEVFALMRAQPRSSLSAANYVEAAIVVDASGRTAAARDFDALLRSLDVVVEPVTADHARIARTAYRSFGKGSGSPARLNFGDCFAYALAVDTREPLLFVGDDFTHTDIRPAINWR